MMFLLDSQSSISLAILEPLTFLLQFSIIFTEDSKGFSSS